MLIFLSAHLLSCLIFLPATGALILLFIRNAETARRIALSFSLMALALAGVLFAKFDTTTAAMQFRESKSWIPAWHINYAVGVDGISALVVILAALLTTISILASWNVLHDRVRGFFTLVLLLETSILGAFLALDLFLFALFGEALLLPLYLLIGVWGGQNRRAAALKFFLHMLAGSVLMLVAILAIAHAAGMTFDVLAIMKHQFSYPFQLTVFAVLFVAFAAKVSIFPFHTLLADVHGEAPAAGSLLLAGAAVTLGAYGFLRFSLPFFPDAAVAWTPVIMVLSLITILYGAVVAFAQTDIKKGIAYLGMSQTGFIMLGIFTLNSQGLEGALLQMVNYGISISALFFAAGILHERTRTNLIADYGGIAAQVPVYAVFSLIIILSSLGMPGTNGFIGAFAILLGAFTYSEPYAVIALLGILLGAGCLLRLYQRIFFGMITNPLSRNLNDMDQREIIAALPLVILVFVLGVYPNVAFGVMHASAAGLIRHMHAKMQTVPSLVQMISDMLRMAQ